MGRTCSQAGYDIRTIQELLHSDVATTMIYTHVLKRGGRGILSPFDRLPAAPALGPQRETRPGPQRPPMNPVASSRILD
jgi:hypothetical protein